MIRLRDLLSLLLKLGRDGPEARTLGSTCVYEPSLFVLTVEGIFLMIQANDAFVNE